MSDIDEKIEEILWVLLKMDWHINHMAEDLNEKDTADDRQTNVEEAIKELKSLIAQQVREARRLERKMMTLQKIDKKLLESEAQKIEFEVHVTDNCRKKHYCAYSSDGKSFSVAMDGQNIVSRQVPEELGE